MKKVFFFLVLILGGWQISDTQGLENLIVGQLNALDKFELNEPVLNMSFKDGTAVKSNNVVVSANGEQIFLVQEGNAEKNGDCRLRRVELKREGVLLKPGPSGKVETCTGHGCSFCDFKKDGGCFCANSYNLCEHSIGRTDDVFNP